MTRAVALLLLLASPLYGQVRASIAGPTSVKPGVLVALDASSSEASGLAWLIFPPETPSRQVNGNRELLFAAGCKPGTSYSVVLIAITLDADKQPIIATETHVVTVEGVVPPPDPDPEPEPDPDPTPVFPDGKYKFSRLAHDLAQSLVPSAVRGKASPLASNFEATASGMAAGAFADLQAGLTDLRTRNAATLGVDREAWLPWFTAFQAEQGRLYEAGTLKTLGDFSIAYREIAVGLRAVQ